MQVLGMPLAMLPVALLAAFALVILMPSSAQVGWVQLPSPTARVRAPTATASVRAPTGEMPRIQVYEGAALNTATERWEDTQVVITKPAAITAISTHVGVEEKRFLTSLAMYMPEATTFVGCTTQVAEALVKATFPMPKLRLVPGLDGFMAYDNRKSFQQSAQWVTFNSKRVDILRIALLEGHDGAWYMDGDTFLLAPLPMVGGQEVLGMNPHRMNTGQENLFGGWNSGILFWRGLRLLKTWQAAGQDLEQKDPKSNIHQQTLAMVAWKHAQQVRLIGCGLNVGKMIREQLREHLACNHGEVQFKNCTIIAGHWHSKDTHIKPIMERALRQCHHPFLKEWLETYSVPDEGDER